MTDALDATLVATLWPARSTARLARDAALVIGGALALAVSAKVQVPFYPVPMTLQTLAVLVLAASYGARLGMAAVALYLVEGLLGAPVFAGAARRPDLHGRPDRRLSRRLSRRCGADRISRRARLGPFVAAAARGDDDRHVVIFAFGYAWLAALVGPDKAFALGVAPFVLATIVKTLLACALVGAAWGAVAELRKA